MNKESVSQERARRKAKTIKDMFFYTFDDLAQGSERYLDGMDLRDCGFEKRFKDFYFCNYIVGYSSTDEFDEVRTVGSMLPIGKKAVEMAEERAVEYGQV